MSLLRVQNIAAAYCAAQALFDVSLSVDAGQVLALMGRNGMGKSTTIKCLTGMMRAAAGQVVLDGVESTRWPSHRVARAGVGLVPEGRRCFGPLSVAENLTAAARPGHWTTQTVTELFPRLGERLSQHAASLSGGEQQMLAIARALMTNPRLLVLDEATEGLAPVVRQEIWAALRKLKAETGMAILIVDKSLRELRQIADDAVVLERGRSVWAGEIGAMTPEITQRYLGV